MQTNFNNMQTSPIIQYNVAQVNEKHNNYFDSIPVELQMQIFNGMDVVDLIHLASVSSALYQTIYALVNEARLKLTCNFGRFYGMTEALGLKHNNREKINSNVIIKNFASFFNLVDEIIVDEQCLLKYTYFYNPVVLCLFQHARKLSITSLPGTKLTQDQLNNSTKRIGQVLEKIFGYYINRDDVAVAQLVTGEAEQFSDLFPHLTQVDCSPAYCLVLDGKMQLERITHLRAGQVLIDRQMLLSESAGEDIDMTSFYSGNHTITLAALEKCTINGLYLSQSTFDTSCTTITMPKLRYMTINNASHLPQEIHIYANRFTLQDITNVLSSSDVLHTLDIFVTDGFDKSVYQNLLSAKSIAPTFHYVDAQASYLPLPSSNVATHYASHQNLFTAMCITLFGCGFMYIYS